MSRKFNDEFVNDIQALLEHGFSARDLLTHYPCVSTAQMQQLLIVKSYLGVPSLSHSLLMQILLATPPLKEVLTSLSHSSANEAFHCHQRRLSCDKALDKCVLHSAILLSTSSPSRIRTGKRTLILWVSIAC